MNRNSVLIAVTVVLLLIAGTLFVVSGGEEDADNSAAAAAAAPMMVSCSACGHTWTIPFSEYDELTDGGKKQIVCESCGEQKGFTAAGNPGSARPPKVVLSDPDSSSGDDEEEDDEYYPEPTQDKPKKPMTSAVRGPG